MRVLLLLAYPGHTLTTLVLFVLFVLQFSTNLVRLITTLPVNCVTLFAAILGPPSPKCKPKCKPSCVSNPSFVFSAGIPPAPAATRRLHHVVLTPAPCCAYRRARR